MTLAAVLPQDRDDFMGKIDGFGSGSRGGK